MIETSKILCRLRLSDRPSPTPGIVRREIHCDLHIEGRAELMALDGTLIGRPGMSLIVDNVTKDDLALGPVKAAELLRALYEDSGLNHDPEQHIASVTDFQVTESDGGILSRIADDFRDSVWE